MPVYSYPLPQPNDVASFVAGKPTASLVMLSLLPAHAFTLPINFSGSRGGSLVAATASTVFIVQKNGVTVGTMTFAIASTVATFSAVAETSLTTSDKLTVVAPVTPDATLSDVGFTLFGIRQ